MKPINNILHGIRDLIVRVLPNIKNDKSYKFAFIVHPRSLNDVTRKYPIFRYFPDSVTKLFTLYYWPVVLSQVSGLVSNITNKELVGYVITIPLSAKQMIEDRSLALKRIVQACKLAEKKGVNIIGLGALTSSISRGGLDLIDKTHLNITTGHAYTSYNVTQNIFALCERFNFSKDKIWIGIVGAAGSIGSTSAKILARSGYNNFVLIDLDRKKHFFSDLIIEMRKLNPAVFIETSHKIGDIKKCDIIIAATNAPETLIRVEDLKTGAIILDDAQPSDVSCEVLDQKDILVVEAGITHTPYIYSHFNFGLKNKTDNFCCMAELLILSANEWNKHYVINRSSLELVDQISVLGDQLGFKIAQYQNAKEIISEEKLTHMKNVIIDNDLQY